MSSHVIRRKCGGFSILELVVVLAVIALLLAIGLRTVTSVKERGRRTACLNNLKQVGAVMTSYAHDNNDLFYPSKHATTNDADGFVPNALNNVSDANVARFGLKRTAEGASIWSCPNRPGLPVFESEMAGGRFGRGTNLIKLDQWVIGYAYFGGVTNWYNSAFPSNSIPSRSPVRLADAKPDWVLAADAVMRVNGKWNDAAEGQRPRPIYWNLPPHHGSGSNKRPTGGNELFADGSAKWFNYEKMFYLTTWKAAVQDHQFFFYQDSDDFDPKLLEHLPELSAAKFK